MRGIIRVGDVHTHGGRVESGAAISKVMGRAVARFGDTCSCPIHGACTIAAGAGSGPASAAPSKEACASLLLAHRILRCRRCNR